QVDRLQLRRLVSASEDDLLPRCKHDLHRRHLKLEQVRDSHPGGGPFELTIDAVPQLVLISPKYDGVGLGVPEHPEQDLDADERRFRRAAAALEPVLVVDFRLQLMVQLIEARGDQLRKRNPHKDQSPGLGTSSTISTLAVRSTSCLSTHMPNRLPRSSR